jgi:hypothetical protein
MLPGLGSQSRFFDGITSKGIYAQPNAVQCDLLMSGMDAAAIFVLLRHSRTWRLVSEVQRWSWAGADAHCRWCLSLYYVVGL